MGNNKYELLYCNLAGSSFWYDRASVLVYFAKGNTYNNINISQIIRCWVFHLSYVEVLLNPWCLIAVCSWFEHSYKESLGHISKFIEPQVCYNKYLQKFT